MSNQISSNIKPIPDKTYFSIKEVSDLCGLKQHVLRYWEKEFSVLKPVRRSAYMRSLVRENIVVVKRIQDLVYHQGLTLEGARKVFSKTEDKNSVSSEYQKELLAGVISDLEKVRLELGS